VALLAALCVGPLAHGQPAKARLGAAVALLADGSAPWEDRPITLAGSGVLTGTVGVADPGDDLGPHDGIVRTFDVVPVRLSYDVLDAAAHDLTLVATLDPELVWQDDEEDRLRYEGCPLGAYTVDDRHVLVCRVGDVAVPPAVTGVVDAVARVRGRAPNGARPKLTLAVSAVNARPDPDTVRCPQAVANGCTVATEPLTVSAALAVDTRKFFDIFGSPIDTVRDGVRGWELRWDLQVLAGGDGDPRGDSVPAAEPLVVHDWWRVTTPAGVAVPGATGSLVGCTSEPLTVWSCGQPAGLDAPVEITLQNIDPDVLRPTQDGANLVANRSSNAVLSYSRLRIFFPRDAVVAAGKTVQVRNCFATAPGNERSAEFAPVDESGSPNLGGLSESLADNCAVATLRVAEDTSGTGPKLDKTYYPGRSDVLEEVVAGEILQSRAYVGNDCGTIGPDLAGVVLCDAFDNQTQQLAQIDLDGQRVAAWSTGRSSSVAEEKRLVGDEVVLEFAAGPWGSWSGPGTTTGQAWYRQSNAACGDQAPVNPGGWVTEAELDFGNSGAGALDAADVNMVRARYRDALPGWGSRTLRTALQVLPNPAGTVLVNYSSVFTGTPPYTRWLAGSCFGAGPDHCPDPPALSSSDPGQAGDARLLVEAPTRLLKSIGYPGQRQQVQRAGLETRFLLQTEVNRYDGYRLARDASGRAVVAREVMITDVLPVGLTLLPGTAQRAAEDVNKNGILEPAEDVNQNGVLDPATAAPPLELHDTPSAGKTTLVWSAGSLSSLTNALTIGYTARLNTLLPGGRVLSNQAESRSASEPAARCSQWGSRYPDRCSYASVTVVNTSRAAVEKTAQDEELQPGQAVHYQLAFANLTRRPIEWLDAVDILPWNGDGRLPPSHLSAPWRAITTTVSLGHAPIAIWASTQAPEVLDVAGGSLPDGVMDPVIAYGAAGAGLGGAEWPCLLADVGSTACPAIPKVADVTALRIWAPDPDPNASGTPDSSLLPVDDLPHAVEVWLTPESSKVGDLFHNAWGGHFEGLTLPAFDDAVARVPIPTLYLPMLVNTLCDPRPVNLVLVLDASSSMRRPSGAGGTKMAAVVAAAGRLVDELLAGGAGHRISVVGFNNHAWVELALTADAAQVHGALNRVAAATAEGTRLELGLAVGAYSLGGTPPDRREMLFLTDGMPNLVPTPIPVGRQEDTVITFAKAVRAQGVVIHAIGYGRPDAPDLADRVSPELLAAIAGSTGDSWVAPDAARLTELFDGLGSDLRCSKQPIGNLP
jgi:hypothetical protein